MNFNPWLLQAVKFEQCAHWENIRIQNAILLNCSEELQNFPT